MPLSDKVALLCAASAAFFTTLGIFGHHLNFLWFLIAFVFIMIAIVTSLITEERDMKKGQNEA